MEWHDYWQEEYDRTKEKHPEFEDSEYYRSGRASKEFPNKENSDWWAKKGPEFVELWTAWREASGLKIACFDQVDESTGELINIPGIELECWAYGPDGLIVRSFIDRVMEDENGNLYVVDLKTGSHTPAWPMQLALNALGLKYNYGEEAIYGGFWKARSGGVEKWTDLRRYTDEWLWDQVWKAREIRDRQLFIPMANNLCTSACGVAKYCVAMGGDPSFFEQRATMTQDATHQGDQE